MNNSKEPHLRYSVLRFMEIISINHQVHHRCGINYPGLKYVGGFFTRRFSDCFLPKNIVCGFISGSKPKVKSVVSQYGENLICALAIAWEKKGRLGSRSFDTVPNRDLLSEEQGQLLDLICSVRALRCDVTLSLIKGVINQPPELPSVFTSRKKKILYEVASGYSCTCVKTCDCCFTSAIVTDCVLTPAPVMLLCPFSSIHKMDL